jgi:hypothetical protein
MHYGGERVVPFRIGGYDRDLCVNLVTRRQNIFAKYCEELWGVWHPFLAYAITASIDQSTPPDMGNEHLWDIYDEMIDTYPDHVINSFVTEFFVPGPVPVLPGRGVKNWVGAQFIAGLPKNAELMRGYPSVWGLIMAPYGIATKPEPTVEQFETVRRGLGVLYS